MAEGMVWEAGVNWCNVWLLPYSACLRALGILAVNMVESWSFEMSITKLFMLHLKC